MPVSYALGRLRQESHKFKTGSEKWEVGRKQSSAEKEASLVW